MMSLIPFQSESASLRSFTGGQLRISFQGQSAREMLPENGEKVFAAGDARGTEMPGEWIPLIAENSRGESRKSIKEMNMTRLIESRKIPKKMMEQCRFLVPHAFIH